MRINVISEIMKGIKIFEAMTGLKPNTLYLDVSTTKRLESIVLKQIKMIEFYPEIFQMQFVKTRSVKGFKVGVMV